MMGHICCNVILVMRRKTCEVFLRRTISNIDIRDHQTISRNISWINYLVVFQVIFQFLSLIWLLVVNWSHFSVYKAMRVVTWLNPQFIEITSGFYLIILMILMASHKSLIRTCSRHIETRGQLVATVMSTIRLIRDSSREFEDLFNVLPVTWFAYGILGAPSIITTWNASLAAGPSIFCVYFMHSVESLVPAIFTVYVVSRLHSSFIQEVDKLRDLIISRKCGDGSEVSVFLTAWELDSLKHIRFTGMSFFALDKSFILTFVGAFATFATLISSFAKSTNF